MHYTNIPPNQPEEWIKRSNAIHNNEYSKVIQKCKFKSCNNM